MLPLIRGELFLLLFLTIFHIVGKHEEFIDSGNESEGNRIHIFKFRDIGKYSESAICHDYFLEQNVLIWAYPIAPPPEEFQTLSIDRIFCAYQSCRDYAESQQISHQPVNLKEWLHQARLFLSSKQYKNFDRFISEQYWYKIQYGLGFSNHVQSVAVVSFLAAVATANASILQEYQVDTCSILVVPFLNHNSPTWQFQSPMKSIEVMHQYCNNYNPTDTTQRAPLVIPSHLKKKFKTNRFAFMVNYDETNNINDVDEIMQTLPGVQFYPYITDYYYNRKNLRQMISLSESATQNVTRAQRITHYVFGDVWWPTGKEITSSSNVTNHIRRRRLHPFPPKNMIMFSMHLTNETFNIPSDKNSIYHYFKDYNTNIGPVGARDETTLSFLKSKGLQAYDSSFFTQMLLLGKGMNTCTSINTNLVDISEKVMKGREVIEVSMNDERDILILAVDVDLNVLPKEVQNQVTVYDEALDTIVDVTATNLLQHKAQMNYAVNLLRLFKNKARVVLTSKIDYAMPASALGIPVIFVHDKKLSGIHEDFTHDDVEGIYGLFHQFYPENGGKGWKFDVHNMKANPGVHQQDRYRASFWNHIKRNGPHWYLDTAQIFGMIPFKRLGEGVQLYANKEEDVHDLFHFIYTSSPYLFTWRDQRAIEAVFFHHPNAKVIIHSNFLRIQELDLFKEVGYNVEIAPINLTKLLMESRTVPIETVSKFIAIRPERKTTEFWYLYEPTLSRLLLIEKYGGVFLDRHHHCVQSIPRSFTNLVGYQENRNTSGEAMIFEKANPFIQEGIRIALKIAIHQYTASSWQSLGSNVFQFVLQGNEKKFVPSAIRMVESDVFYPYSGNITMYCFTPGKETRITNNTYAVHLDMKVTQNFKSTKADTECDKLFHNHCIFCDEIFTANNMTDYPDWMKQ